MNVTITYIECQSCFYKLIFLKILTINWLLLIIETLKYLLIKGCEWDGIFSLQSG